jgi:hypothetical protein
LELAGVFLEDHMYTSQDIIKFQKARLLNFIPDQHQNGDMIYKADLIEVQYETRLQRSYMS